MTGFDTPRGGTRRRDNGGRTALGLVALLLASLAGALVGCGDPAPVKIGFIGGLTGRSADIGEASRNAVQLAVEEANRDGGISGRRIELLVRDDENDPGTAAAAMRALHAAGVVAVIGPNVSAIATGLLPVANELELVAVSPTVSSLVFAGLDDFLFRINWSTRDNARIYASRYAARGIRRVAAAVDTRNRVFSESWLSEFSAAFGGQGGHIVASELFDAGQPQGYSDTARRLLAAAPDAILLIANSVDTAQLAQQIRKLEGDVLLVAAEWAASEKLLYLGGAAIEGLELVQSYDRNDRSERYVRFRDAYRNRFGGDPGYSSVAAYDAVTVLFRALATRHDGQPLKEALLALESVQGLQQQILFDRFGDARRQAFFTVIRGGKFTTP